MEGTSTDLWVKWKCGIMVSPVSVVWTNFCTWGAGTGNGTDQIQAVEEKIWWHFLHPQLLKNSFTILTESGQPSSSLWSRKKTGHSLSLTRYSGEEKMAAWMSLSTGSPCTWTNISTLSPIIDVKTGVVRCLPRLGERDHQHAGQPSEGSSPPC